jgi:hypothetical protein
VAMERERRARVCTKVRVRRSARGGRSSWMILVVGRSLSRCRMPRCRVDRLAPHGWMWLVTSLHPACLAVAFIFPLILENATLESVFTRGSIIPVTVVQMGE